MAIQDQVSESQNQILYLAFFGCLRSEMTAGYMPIHPLVVNLFPSF